ncbi:hypothetical protein MAR_032113 [Mya arenaria]|uniref:Uncharacterized protein n=1 Tax=Mya arenaria TaxID=6604 RepID=A0ABY7F820_MYAAR|nr:hypothetical protein MAR_032113 [Mya arenaria]
MFQATNFSDTTELQMVVVWLLLSDRRSQHVEGET